MVWWICGLFLTMRAFLSMRDDESPATAVDIRYARNRYVVHCKHSQNAKVVVSRTYRASTLASLLMTVLLRILIQ